LANKRRFVKINVEKEKEELVYFGQGLNEHTKWLRCAKTGGGEPWGASIFIFALGTLLDAQEGVENGCFLSNKRGRDERRTSVSRAISGGNGGRVCKEKPQGSIL